jgi:hypothetical protein
MASLASLGVGCVVGEEGSEIESMEYSVSKELQLRWIHDVESEDQPILSFARKSDLPTAFDKNLVFRAQPPIAVPGGVLCDRGGDLVYLDAGTGEEIWSYPVSTEDWLQLSLQGDRIAVYEGSGQLVVLSLEGKRIGSFEVMSDALLDSDGEQVYLLSRKGIQACSLEKMQVVWNRISLKKMRFHSMFTGNRQVAVGYYQHSVRQQETALLDRKTGSIRHRFRGRGVGWSDQSFFTFEEKNKEVWQWRDASGAFLRKQELENFIEGEILCYRGDIIYSGENRYYSPAVTHLGRGGRYHTSTKTVVRRDLQRNGHWQIPYRGDAILFQEVLLDLDSGGVTGWDVSTGKRLFEIRMKDSPRRVALGKKHLFVLTRSGSLQAFEIRE